jgi:serine/threonine protein kinase
MDDNKLGQYKSIFIALSQNEYIKRNEMITINQKINSNNNDLINNQGINSLNKIQNIMINNTGRNNRKSNICSSSEKYSMKTQNINKRKSNMHVPPGKNNRRSVMQSSLYPNNRKSILQSPFNSSNRATLLRMNNLPNNASLNSPRTPSVSTNQRSSMRKRTTVMTSKNNRFMILDGPQPNRNLPNAPLLYRNLQPPQSSVMASSPIKVSVVNKAKMNSIRYAPRASILDIYGELSNYFPVKENDEVVKRARETGNRMSIMLEKVQKLKRTSIENLNQGKNLHSLKQSVIDEEPEVQEESTEVSKKNTSSPLSSKANLTENNDKIEDMLINNLFINSNNKRGTMKPTKSNVFKVVIQTQGLLKARNVPKPIVIKKSNANIENKDKDKTITPSQSTEKNSMKPSPLRDNFNSESNLSPNSAQKPKPGPIKTKVTLHKLAASLSASPNSANSAKNSPSSASVKSTGSFSAQQRRLADIESGNMSEELKHRTSHIINIKSPSISIPNTPKDTDSIVLVSPSTIVHASFDYSVHEKEDKNNENNKSNKTEEDKYELTTKSESESEITSPNDELWNLEYNDKPINYIVGKLIGQGSYGKVYYGINQDNNQIMAIKQVDIKNKMMVDSLSAEINLLRDLNHENIVLYYGCEFKKTFNVFLEYVSGGSVASMLIRFGKFGESLAKSLTSQILSGLEYLHQKKIIHRDIKGANILVDEDGIAKISDFGISKKNIYENAYKKQTRMSLKGTVYWMAPEVVNGKGYSAKVDIWSVGCCVLEMLTGTHPWINFNDVQPVLYKLCTRNRPELPESLGSVARDFIDKSLSIDPEVRPTASELLKHQFVVEQDEDFNYHDYYDEAVAKENEEVLKEEAENEKNLDDDWIDDVDDIDDYFDESAMDDDSMIGKDNYLDEE